MRKPIVAGSFYPSSADELKKQLSDFFKKVGKDIKKNKVRNAKVIIAPHAGYVYSGLCAAYAYSALGAAEYFVILGTNHTGYGSKDFIFSQENFSTPLGIAGNESKMVSVLIKECERKGIGVEINETAHAHEHSIEVQLPFLQFLFGGIKIVPVIVNNLDAEKIKRFARVMADVIEKSGKKMGVVASSDFTHYGDAYGFTPFTLDIKKNLYKLDKEAISEILKFNSEKFLGKAAETTICGAGAIATCIEISNLLGCKKAELLEYYTSGDIVNDYSNAVGYAAIAFC